MEHRRKHLSKNRFLAMRHGQSRANELKLIASWPENAVHDYGLTAEGVRQAQKTAREIHAMYGSVSAIYASDILRALQTAEEVRRIMGLDMDIKIVSGLRERHFGSLELQSDERYKEVWRWDQAVADASPAAAKDYCGVERATSVAERLLAMAETIDAAHDSETILIVSHGDPLDILFATLQGRHPGNHRENPFVQAECRPFPLATP